MSLLKQSNAIMFLNETSKLLRKLKHNKNKTKP